MHSDAAVAAGLFSADRVRQKSGRFLVHGAAVSTERGALLFVGDSGSGKTSVALLLAALGNMRLVSGDVIPLVVADGRLCTEGHWCTVRVRATGIRDIIDASARRTALSVELREWVEGGEQAAGWDRKKLVMPHEVGVDVAPGVSPVVGIVDLRVLSNTYGLVCNPVSPSWQITPMFYGLMNSAMSGHWVLVDDSGVVRSEPLSSSERDLVLARMEAARLAAGVPAVCLRGALERIVGSLLGWFEGNARTGVAINNWDKWS